MAQRGNGSWLDALGQTGLLSEETKNERKKESEEKAKKQQKENYSKLENQRSPQGKKGYGNKNNGIHFGKSEGYVGAPYNFIRIDNKVREYEGDIPAQNSVSQELHSGEISVEITAKQEIHVGGGQRKADKSAGKPEPFYRNPYGKYAIPGSTLRGLMRNNLQLLSFSYFGDDIEDYSLMYRDITGLLKDPYNNVLGFRQIPQGKGSVSVLENVKAGYIAKESGKYVIYGTENRGMREGMNYFVISEKYISEHVSEFEYLYSDKFGHKLQYKKNAKFRKEVQGKRIHYKSYDVEKDYKPFHEKISYKINNNNRVVGIGAYDDNSYKLKGEIVGTGFMNEKKALYIIPEIDKDAVPVPEIEKKDVDTYIIDFNCKKNNFGKNLDFYKLPESGDGIRPVFYISLDGKLYFGYTPRLRLFYKHTIKEGLHQKKPEMDMANAIFGFIGEKSARKGRVSFTDAVAEADHLEEKEKKYIMGAPKASSYLDYIVQDTRSDKVTSYDSDDFSLRGVKQYWNKVRTDSESDGSKDNVTSKLNVLPKGTKFSGHIRYNNLTTEELGLLLWSIELSEKALQNIGKAKAYGYGTIKQTISMITEFNPDKAYGNELVLDPSDDITSKKDELINEAKKKLNEWYGKNAEESLQISSFMKMKENVIDNEFVRYMKIDKPDKDYQKRKGRDNVEPLPEIAEVIKQNSQKK